jgi:hypothetical protein
MNDNYYWDEYIKFYVDKNIKKDIQKFFLSTSNNLFKYNNNIPDFSFDRWKSKLQNNIYPDAVITSTQFTSLDSEIAEVATLIAETISNTDLVTFLPILSINSSDNTILNYGININESELILYNKCKCNYMKVNDLKYVISYFMNLDESILMYGSESYTNTILEIGYIKKTLEKKLSINYLLKEFSKHRQEWTHDLGINPNRELLITTTSLGSKT